MEDKKFRRRGYLFAFLSGLGLAPLDGDLRASLSRNVGAHLAGVELALTGGDVDTDLKDTGVRKEGPKGRPRAGLTSLNSTVHSLRGTDLHFSTSSQTLTGRSLHT